MPKRLSQAEIFYIEENPGNLTPEKLSSELGFGINIIKKYLKPKVEPQVTQEIKAKSIPQSENVHEMLARRIKDGRVSSVVMTPGASQRADDTRQGRVSMKDGIKNAIHKPLGNYNPRETSSHAVIAELEKKVKALQEENAKLKNDNG